MAGFLLRRLGFGAVALFLGLSASFYFFSTKFFPLRGQPFLHAYWQWLRGLPTGHNLAHGLLNDNLLSTLGVAFARTMLLLGLTCVIVLAISIPLACLAAAKRGTLVDVLLRGASYSAWAAPGFVVALLLQQAFGVIPTGWGLGWFPSGGWPGECTNGLGIDAHYHCPGAGTGLTHVGLMLYHVALPAIALALGFIGPQARYLRNSLLDALDAPYMTVARAKGLSERELLLRHGLRNALVSFVPAVISDFGLIFGAALVADYIFRLGGLGTLFISLLPYSADGAPPVDTYALQFVLLLAGAFMLATSVLGEVGLWLLDPRTRSS